MSRIENPREAIKDDSTGIFCLSIMCQYGLLTFFLFIHNYFLNLKINKGWEQRKLGETLTGFEYGLNTPATDYDGINKYLRITDIDDVSHKFDTSHLTSPKLKDDNYLLAYGDILFARTGASVGKSYRYSNIDGKVYYAGFLIKAHIKDHFSTNFIFDTTLLPRYHYFVQVTSMRSGQPGINAKEYQKYIIYTPSENEQNKISDLVLTIQNLIDLQQRKLEILIKLKRSFLTKSMANSLDKNPELYFNSASVKWLKQKLSDLTIKEFKGNTKLNDTKPGKTEYLDAERLNGNVPLFIDKPINTLKSDILILWDGSKAGSVYYGFEGSLGSTLKAIRLNPKLVNSFFVYQQLKSKQDVIFNKYRTPNIPHVIKNFTKVYPIYFPSMAVQNKIARFLGNLDTLIEIQQKSIKDHKVIKKYLLQKLFI